MLRPHLDEISSLLGPYVSEEAEVVVERNPEEVAFLNALAKRIAVFKDIAYPTSAGASLKVVAIRKPLEDMNSEQFEFVVPFIVIFDGKAAPEVWAEAEGEFEKQAKAAVEEVAGEFFEEPSVRLVRRKKSDPYKDDPRSLTLLRFRLS